MNQPKAIIIMSDERKKWVYSKDVIAQIQEHCELLSPSPISEEEFLASPHMGEVEIIFTGWKTLAITEGVLERCGQLKAWFHGAGTIKPILKTDRIWDRNITVSTAAMANAIPVAEFCLGQILLSLKRYWAMVNEYREIKQIPDRNLLPGNYKSKIGIITLGAISGELIKYLSMFEHEVRVFSRSLSDEGAKELGVVKSSVEEIFESCHVVSLHTPLLDATKGMIGRQHFEKMLPYSTFINTARGAVVDQDEMLSVAEARSDLSFLLDVSDPEPALPDSMIYRLDNVQFSPHLGGSQGPECERMGQMMVDELKRYIGEEDLCYQVSKDKFLNMA